MLHHLPRVAGLVAMLAALILAPTAQAAASPSKARTGASAKERAYGKRCGPKSKAVRRASARAKCLDAMARLASGDATSPSKACRALSKKKRKGERKSAFARCVAAGARVLQASKRGERGSDDDAGDDPDDEGADEPSLGEPDPTDDLDSDLDEGDETDLDPFADASTDDDDDSL